MSDANMLPASELKQILRGKKILLAEDEPDLLEVIAWELREAGLVVSEAADGKAALELARREAFDVVLSDIRMPGGNGIWLLDEIKKLNRHLPVTLLMTAYSDISIEDAFQKGAASLLSKPIDWELLQESIALALLAVEKKWCTDPGRPIHATIRSSPSDIHLGQAGVFIALEKDLPGEDAIVRFDLAVKDGQAARLCGDGIVRWVRRKPAQGLKAGCGVEFLWITEPESKELVGLIEDFGDRIATIPKS